MFYVNWKSELQWGEITHGGCDRSAEDAYSSMAPDPTFGFVGGPCCPTLDVVYLFLGLWLRLKKNLYRIWFIFNTLFTSPFYIKAMLEFLIDSIFVIFCDYVFQQTVGIPMGTNYAALLADLFLYSYEA